MNANTSKSPLSVERYRHYLHSLARLNVADECRGQLDPSDMVQQTLLQAHNNLKSFRGQSESEFKAWLRAILGNTLANAVRALGTKKRDVNLERSIGAAIEDSSCRLDNWLAAEQSSPSDQAAHNELVLQVVRSMSELPEDQRTAIEMRYLRQMSIQDICLHFDRSEGAVAGLITRGIATLRSELSAPDTQGERP